MVDSRKGRVEIALNMGGNAIAKWYDHFFSNSMDIIGYDHLPHRLYAADDHF